MVFGKFLRHRPPITTEPGRLAMVRWLHSLLSVLVLVSPQAFADSGIARLEAFQANVQSLEARFRQQVMDANRKVLEDTSGSVVMQRPGRFRWNYQAPFERVIVADGAKVWLYEADLDQVTIRLLSAGIGATPAALLTGKDTVRKHFDVGKSWVEDGLAFVRLTPKSTEAEFAGVTIGFKGAELSRLLLDDRLGQQTRIDLSEVRINPRLSPELFRFESPPGADVIDDSEL
jgi:outer membrane lipoprotein carrier protein